MWLEDHFGNGSILQRNERAKLAASFWNNTGAGMVIGGIGAGFFFDNTGGALGKNRHCIAGLVLVWLCYSIASNMPANDRLGSKAVRRRGEKDDVGFCQIGKEAIRFTRPPIGLRCYGASGEEIAPSSPQQSDGAPP